MTETILETCNFFYLYAGMVWEKIRFYRKADIRISETTLTENLIFDLWNHGRNGALAVEIYEAKDEKSNGNDIEIFVEMSSGYILLVCQAKIIDRDGKYRNISYKPGGQYQIDLLNKYAKKLRGIPGYLFYNFIYDHNTINSLELHRNNLPALHYGMSFCPSTFIRKNFWPAKASINQKVKIPRFEDLHPHQAAPLVDIICNLLHNNINHVFSFWGDEMIRNFEPKFYTKMEVEDSDHWNEVLPRPSIGYVPGLDIDKLLPLSKDQEVQFSPKYRVMISKEKLISRLSEIS